MTVGPALAEHAELCLVLKVVCTSRQSMPCGGGQLEKCHSQCEKQLCHQQKRLHAWPNDLLHMRIDMYQTLPEFRMFSSSNLGIPAHSHEYRIDATQDR